MVGALKQLLSKYLPAAVKGRLRAWRVKRSVRTFPTRVVEHSYGGHPLKVFLADSLSEGWYDRDWPPLPEIEALREGQLRPGARVFDVGAHQAVVAAMLAHAIGPTGQVVAVEANPHNCLVARKNRDLNGLANIEIVEAAASDKPGTITFNERLNGQIDDGSGAAGRLTVSAVTLDGLADRFGIPDVVFLDIEGAEYLALQGASRVLEAGPDVFVEVHRGCGLEKLGGTVDKLLSYFPEDRYARAVRGPSDDKFHPLQPGDSVMAERFFLIALRRK